MGYRFILLTCLCFSLSSCGFKLRGYAAVPESLKILSITPNTPFEPFQKRLIAMLKNNQITVLAAGAQNLPILELIQTEFQELPLSYAPDGSVIRAKIVFEVHYQLLDKTHKVHIPKQKILSQRILNVSKNTLLSDQTERQMLKEDLWLETAHKLLRQLAH